MNVRNKTARRPAGGFTLVEMSMSMAILTLLTVGIFNVFYQVLQAYNETSLMSTTAVQASFALDRMVIGIGTNAGLREAQASTVTTTSTSTNWQFSYNSGLSFAYSANNHAIVDQSGNYVVSNLVASTLTNTTNGVQISVSVAQSCGGRTLTNTMATFVEFRN
jgi:prepilin-type N-terminal cleavage/methylation domain-containing protein